MRPLVTTNNDFARNNSIIINRLKPMLAFWIRIFTISLLLLFQDLCYAQLVSNDTIYTYGENGQIETIQYTVSNNLHKHQSFYTNGRKKEEGHFSYYDIESSSYPIRKSGKWTYYYPNGYIRETGLYGKINNYSVGKIGLWLYFDKEGNLFRTENHKNHISEYSWKTQQQNLYNESVKFYSENSYRWWLPESLNSEYTTSADYNEIVSKPYDESSFSYWNEENRYQSITRSSSEYGVMQTLSLKADRTFLLHVSFNRTKKFKGNKEVHGTYILDKGNGLLHLRVQRIKEYISNEEYTDNTFKKVQMYSYQIGYYKEKKKPKKEQNYTSDILILKLISVNPEAMEGSKTNGDLLSLSIFPTYTDSIQRYIRYHNN